MAVNKTKPYWRDLLLLATLGFIFSSLIAFFQRSPGYMDADYYYAGGLQLATGKGFSEPYLWNYLDNPVALPHPSNAYWMPLASIIAALGMLLTGISNWFTARIGFLLICALIPIVTYKLAYSFSGERKFAFASGFLAIFSGFYSVFLPVTDTFGIYILLGGLFFLSVVKNNKWRNISLGVIAGFMHLSRADGILWLFIAFLVVSFLPETQTTLLKKIKRISLGFKSVLAGYLLIMGGWLIRNEVVFGSLLAPGGNSMLWLTGYDQIFSYPPDAITFQAWLQNGINKALEVRLWALNINLQNTLAIQGSIILFPLILIGIWSKRKDPLIMIAVLTWCIYLLVMSVVFPFAGARGGFFHSGAALQPVWWSLAPIGLASLVRSVGLKRNWEIEKATKNFMVGMVVFSILVSGVIIFGKLYSPSVGWDNWNTENSLYQKVNIMIETSAGVSSPTVIVSNPPGFYLVSGFNSIAIPFGDVNNTLAVARKFSADFLVLENGAIPEGLNSLYQDPVQFPDFNLIGEVEDTLVFKIIR